MHLLVLPITQILLLINLILKIAELEGGMMAWRNAGLKEEVGKSKRKASIRIQDFTKEDLILVDFYADWCQPCKKMKPIVDQLEKETIGENFRIVRINVDENPEDSKKYKVQLLPTFLLLKNHQEVKRKEGLVQKDELKAMIDQFD